MLAHSTACNPVIVGSSVHNIRIERLWRDTFRCVLSVFYQLFCFLEECGELDPLSENDLYCLHFVYKPRINKALEAFMYGWNNHALTTEHCKTPLQLFTSGTLLCGTHQDTIERGVESTPMLDTSGGAVPEVNSPLAAHQEEELRGSVDPLQESSNYAIEIYQLVKQFVSDNICDN